MGTEAGRSGRRARVLPNRLTNMTKIYKWDCCTLGELCEGCPYYHVLTEGARVHECPRGIRKNHRRIG